MNKQKQQDPILKLNHSDNINLEVLEDMLFSAEAKDYIEAINKIAFSYATALSLLEYYRDYENPPVLPGGKDAAASLYYLELLKENLSKLVVEEKPNVQLISIKQCQSKKQ